MKVAKILPPSHVVVLKPNRSTVVVFILVTNVKTILKTSFILTVWTFRAVSAFVWGWIAAWKMIVKKIARSVHCFTVDDSNMAAWQHYKSHWNDISADRNMDNFACICCYAQIILFDVSCCPWISTTWEADCEGKLVCAKNMMMSLQLTVFTFIYDWTIQMLKGTFFFFY